eukprot:4738373-Amphidinium_carterae.1
MPPLMLWLPRSFLKAVAIGGPFLHNNTLVLASTTRSCLWNQEVGLFTLHLPMLENIVQWHQYKTLVPI